MEGPRQMDQALRQPCIRRSMSAPWLRWTWQHSVGAIRRYGVAELVELVVMLGCATMIDTLTANSLLIALSAWGGSAGYYGVLLAQELWGDRRACNQRGTAYGWRGAGRTTAKLVWGFGGAEALDSVLSPLLMFVCVEHIANLELAVILCNIGSGVLFYAVVALARGRYPRH